MSYIHTQTNAKQLVWNAPAYKKVASYEAIKGNFGRCLLLYSGGLDTSVMLKWLQEEYGCEVVALTVDIGQRADDLEAIRQKALDLGAVEALVYDAKTEFAESILSLAIQANADYQGGYTLHTPLGRVMISKIAVQIAEKSNCEVVAHGCTGKGNDQVRFESYITTLAPHLKIIAPVREWAMGRAEELAYAKKHGINVIQTEASLYSYDENMWGNSAEGGEIEKPSLEAPLEKILRWCNPIASTPIEPAYITIEFAHGVPVGVQDKKMPLVDIISHCNLLGARHGVGVVHLIEDRLVGLKVRGIFENPGGTILTQAHKKLEMLVSTRVENEMKSFIDQKWAYLLYAAQWFEPTMAHLHAYIKNQNKKVSGSVTVKLHQGSVVVVSLDSPYSLFNENLATFERNPAFNQNASPGFIEIYNLSQQTSYGVYNYEQ
ncbi:argininosuccinate synthase [Candidatus Saccharibacteria bacterium]|nr:MAG: argininosuccinate synthase [Candidatus Saccharibacteria bacterium]